MNDYLTGVCNKMKRNNSNDIDYKLALATIEPFNVILEGESGVGKEYFANLIHKKRSWAKDFIVIDWECDYQNQLKILDNFPKDHLRRITDLGDGQKNTYFFRRIDLLDLQVQINLLEVLEEWVKRGAGSKSQLYRLGLISSREKTRNGRIQHNNLSSNPFREIFPSAIEVPPLRKRRKEIHSISYSILHSVNQKQNRKVVGFSEESIEMFSKYSWPNNLDELESEIERAVALTRDYDVIKPQVLSTKLVKNLVLSRTI
jgi:DNA-binding NtrC family response regulator